jgi:type IV pilus assembly protein PilV
MKSNLKTQAGTTMIEVLVTVVIISLGLLGLAGLQSRLQVSEMEAYQRSQALLLLDDMANRITINRNNAGNYVTNGELGFGVDCPNANATLHEKDKSEWCNALQGAAEVSGANRVGAMVGARGCVQDIGGNEYLITVAWQGLTPISAPPANLSCGASLYDGGAGSACTNDRCRRTVTTIVRIGNLS